jgi:hypothetical protein
VKKFIQLAFLVVLISACKMGQEVKEQETKDVGGIKVQEGRVFSTTEMKIIKDVCGHLKAKREYFESIDDRSLRFNFSFSNLYCSGFKVVDVLFYALISNVNSTDLEYYSTKADILRNVITDQTTGVKYLCDNVEAKNLNNFYTEGTIQYSFNVLINQGYNRFEIIKSTIAKNGDKTPKVSEAIDFISNKNQGPTKYFGVEKDRTKNSVCPDGNISTTRQFFISDGN